MAIYRDPIAEEVRAIRERLAAECDFDIRKIVEEAQRRQAASKSRLVSYERAPRPNSLAAAAKGADPKSGEPPM